MRQTKIKQSPCVTGVKIEVRCYNIEKQIEYFIKYKISLKIKGRTSKIILIYNYVSVEGSYQTLISSHILTLGNNPLGFPDGSDGKESICNVGDLGSIRGLGRSPGGRHGNLLQYSCLPNPHDQRSLAGYNAWDYTVGHDSVWGL